MSVSLFTPVVTPAQLALDLARPCIAEGRAEGLARGVCRLLDAMGICPLVEVPLGTGRRADVVGQDSKGRFVIVEIKSGLADFRADTKWQDYRDHCDRLYFAVGNDFPLDVLPDCVGAIVADRFGAEIRREAPLQPMAQGFASQAGHSLRPCRRPSAPLLPRGAGLTSAPLRAVLKAAPPGA